MRIVFIFLAFNSFLASAQVKFSFEDDFLSDWEQKNEKNWEISSLDPIFGKSSLHHSFDNPNSGTDQISHAFTNIPNLNENISWDFKVRHVYSPSSSNNWAFFLASGMPASDMLPSGKSNALVVGVNFEGSDDLLKIWKIQDGKNSVVLQSNLNWETQIADSTASIRIIRKPNEEYSIELKVAQNSEYKVIANGLISYSPTFNHFGIYYKYSSSQDRKLWFDDISIDAQFITDTQKPVIDAAYFSSRTGITLVFDKEIDAKSIALEDFAPEEGNNFPTGVDVIAYNSVKIYFGKDFVSGTTIGIAVKNVKDRFGNEMEPISIDLNYYEPHENDIVITEIMADPTPTVGLPDFEYIEIFNKSAHAIDLNKWTVNIDNNKFTLLQKTIAPNKYLVFSHINAANTFEKPATVVPLFTNEYTLNNSGAAITLIDSNENVMNFVQYTPDWHLGKYKAEGGWSLELIDVNNPCNGSKSWASSTNKSGGTPGFENSIVKENPDEIAPEFNALAVPNDSSVLLLFTEPLNISKSINSGNFEISENRIKSVTHSNNFNEILLVLDKSLVEDKLYSLTIKDTVCDCANNKLLKTFQVQFQKPVEPDSAEIIINEILTNAPETGSEFIEIYNRSAKYINAGGLIVATLDSLTNEVKSHATILPEGLTIAPKQYFVLTYSVENLKSSYKLDGIQNIIELENFPTLTNDNGCIALIKKNLQQIDKLVYNRDMHYPLLTTIEGVSLERLNANWPTQSFSNWHSAAQTAGFATPGKQNSQMSSAASSSNNIKIAPEVFTPNNDGIDDFVTINLNQSNTDALASINIYNANGIIVKHLINRQLISTNNSFTWNGVSDDNKIQPPGIYVIHTSYFTKSGKVKESKNVVVIGVR